MAMTQSKFYDIKINMVKVFRILAIFLAFSALAIGARAEIGVVAAVNKVLSGQPPNAKERELFLSNVLVADEKLTTSEVGNAQILMLDQTSISISPNSELVLDEFIYDPDQNIGKIALSLSKGVMRFVGGKISKNKDAVVQTPSASMSIRGGLALIKVDNLGATEVIHVAGEYTKITSGGRTLTLSRPEARAVISAPQIVRSDNKKTSARAQKDSQSSLSEPSDGPDDKPSSDGGPIGLDSEKPPPPPGAPQDEGPVTKADGLPPLQPREGPEAQNSTPIPAGSPSLPPPPLPQGTNVGSGQPLVTNAPALDSNLGAVPVYTGIASPEMLAGFTTQLNGPSGDPAAYYALVPSSSPNGSKNNEPPPPSGSDANEGKPAPPSSAEGEGPPPPPASAEGKGLPPTPILAAEEDRPPPPSLAGGEAPPAPSSSLAAGEDRPSPPGSLTQPAPSNATIAFKPQLAGQPNLDRNLFFGGPNVINDQPISTAGEQLAPLGQQIAPVVNQIATQTVNGNEGQTSRLSGVTFSSNDVLNPFIQNSDLTRITNLGSIVISNSTLFSSNTDNTASRQVTLNEVENTTGFPSTTFFEGSEASSLGRPGTTKAFFLFDLEDEFIYIQGSGASSQNDSRIATENTLIASTFSGLNFNNNFNASSGQTISQRYDVFEDLVTGDVLNFSQGGVTPSDGILDNFGTLFFIAPPGKSIYDPTAAHRSENGGKVLIGHATVHSNDPALRQWSLGVFTGSTFTDDDGDFQIFASGFGNRSINDGSKDAPSGWSVKGLGLLDSGQGTVFGLNGDYVVLSPQSNFTSTDGKIENFESGLINPFAEPSFGSRGVFGVSGVSKLNSKLTESQDQRVALTNAVSDLSSTLDKRFSGIVNDTIGTVSHSLHGFTAGSLYSTDTSGGASGANRIRKNAQYIEPTSTHIAFEPSTSDVAMFIRGAKGSDTPGAFAAATYDLGFGALPSKIVGVSNTQSAMVNDAVFGANAGATDELWTGGSLKVNAAIEGNQAEQLSRFDSPTGFNGAMASVGLVGSGGDGQFNSSVDTTPEFYRWGYWTGSFSYASGSGTGATGIRQDHFNLNPWVAGSPVDNLALPQTGKASYNGFVVGHIDDGAGEVVADGGGFTATADFGNRSITANFTDLFGQDFSVSNMSIESIGAGYTGTASASLSGSPKSIEVNGLFFKAQRNGSIDTAAATGGSLVFKNGQQLVGSGVFGGDRVSD